jgi:alcohol dehydrogenase class IV
MKFNSGASKTKLMKIARATGAKTIPEGIKNIQNLIKKTGLAKPLKAYGAKRADIPKVAGMAISPRIMNNPRPVKEKDVKAILERLL